MAPSEWTPRAVPGKSEYSVLIGCGGAGDLAGGAPYAVDLRDDERLRIAGAVFVGPAGAAVPDRGAGHGGDLGVPVRVERGGAGDLTGGVPLALHLAGHEHLSAAGVIFVGPAGAAVPSSGARHRPDLRERESVQGPEARHLLPPAPLAVYLADDQRIQADKGIREHV
jgi:hypothetical protein